MRRPAPTLTFNDCILSAQGQLATASTPLGLNRYNPSERGEVCTSNPLDFRRLITNQPCVKSFFYGGLHKMPTLTFLALKVLCRSVVDITSASRSTQSARLSPSNRQTTAPPVATYRPAIVSAGQLSQQMATAELTKYLCNAKQQTNPNNAAHAGPLNHVHIGESPVPNYPLTAHNERCEI